MGSDDTHVTDPVLAVQEPESASGAKTKPSHGSGVADGSEPSGPSSRRHQEQVQNLKEQSDNFMDGPMGTDDNLINETEAPVKEPDIPSVASMRSGGADPMSAGNSGGGDGIGAPCPWSLTEEEHVQNLKNNCRRAFGDILPGFIKTRWADVQDDPWFERVVRKLRADLGGRLDNFKLLVIEDAPFCLLVAHPLHLAVLMGDLEMVQKILAETRSGPLNQVDIDSHIWGPGMIAYSALDLAIVVGESEMVDALLEKNAKVNTGRRGSLQLAVLLAPQESTSKIIQSLVRKVIDINDQNYSDYSAFYIAVTKGKTDIVKELLDRWKDKIKLNEACKGGRPPIQIANEEGFKDIESALMQYEDVRRFIEEAFRNRQAYVDAANAILVGAALIASVTFASWLQPPLSYTTSYHGSSLQYVDVEHNIALGSFWVFNTLSFYFAIGTVVFGAHSVLPRKQLFITENVKKLSQNLLLTSILLAFSVLFVIVAFGIAGFIVLIPILRYRWYMIAPTMLGGIVCVGSIGYLFKSVWEKRPWNNRNRKRNRSESNRIDLSYDFND